MLSELVTYAREHLEDGDQPPPFYALRPVRWTLTITPDGTPWHGAIGERVDDERRYGIPYMAPSVTRTVGVAPAVGTDSIEYVLGRDHESTEPGYASARAAKRLAAFIELHQSWAAADPDSTAAAAITAFYRDGHHHTIELPERVDAEGNREPGWQRSDLIAFIVEGERTDACMSDSAQAFWRSAAIGRKAFDAHGVCLVCRETGQLLKTLPQQLPQRLVPGATQNPALTSINKSSHGFRLAEDLRHTPICVDCGLRAVTALKHLLGDVDHSTLTGRGRMIWWSRGPEAPVDALQYPDQHLDDVTDMIGAAKDADVDAVDLAEEAVERFYSATISGNVARVVVADWIDMPLAAVHRNLGHWFEQIQAAQAGPGAIPGVGRLALACGKRVRDGKSSKYADFKNKGADRPETVMADLYAAALFGRPLPRRLTEHLVRRFSRDGYIDRWRATLLRYWFNHTRITDEERIPMALDEERDHPAYLAGRLFALYESLQYTANNPRARKPRPGQTGEAEGEGDAEAGPSTELNSSFHDRYYAGALKNPAIAIVAGEELSAAWLKRVRGHRPELAGWFEKTFDGIISRLNGTPAAANLDDKVQFLLGYHHQRQARRDAAGTGPTEPTTEETA